MNSGKSRNSRLRVNVSYCATGDTFKNSGLEDEITLNTGASCSDFIRRTLWEICKLQHPVTMQKSTKVMKTCSGQTVAVCLISLTLIGSANITFCYEPDGQIVFPLTFWITGMKTQNNLGITFWPQQSLCIPF